MRIMLMLGTVLFGMSLIACGDKDEDTSEEVDTSAEEEAEEADESEESEESEEE